MQIVTLLAVLWWSWAALPPAVAATAEAAESAPRRNFQALDKNHDGFIQAEEFAPEHAQLYARQVRISDANRDGRLSLKEFESGLRPHRPAKPIFQKPGSRLPGADALLLLVAMMDVNADAVIESEEVPENLRRFYEVVVERLGGKPGRSIRVHEFIQSAPRLTRAAQLEANRLGLDVQLEIALLSDEKFDLVERLDGPRMPGLLLANPDQALQLFQRLDADGDGKVQFQEVPQPFADRFDRLLARADRDRDDQLSEQEMRALSRRLRLLVGDSYRRNRAASDSAAAADSDATEESPMMAP